MAGKVKNVFILCCRTHPWSEACLMSPKRIHRTPCLGGGPSWEEGQQSGALVFSGPLRVRLPACLEHGLLPMTGAQPWGHAEA